MRTISKREIPSDARFSKQWRSVVLRDCSADGKFVYAVLSTGIYCRPSCPSRKPRRDRVIFFLTSVEADEQGFRPCQRCHPQAQTVLDATARIVERVSRAIRTQAASGEYRPKEIRELAASLGMKAHQLDHAFRRALGVTPRQFADSCRISNLKSRLKEGMNVTEALYEAGYSSSSRLYEYASAHLGMTPATYKKGGAGMRIGYRIVDSPFGRLLVASTEHGISALYLGDSDGELVAALREEYPRAEISIDNRGLRAAVAEILDHLRGRQPRLDLPMDVQATAFQRRVWEELRRIPYGATKTYSEIAQAVGKPAAIRAVARACATNPVSLIVPCHRVVRKSNLAGYRWGLQRKKALLEAETAKLAETKSLKERPRATARDDHPGKILQHGK